MCVELFMARIVMSNGRETKGKHKRVKKKKRTFYVFISVHYTHHGKETRCPRLMKQMELYLYKT